MVGDLYCRNWWRIALEAHRMLTVPRSVMADEDGAGGRRKRIETIRWIW